MSRQAKKLGILNESCFLVNFKTVIAPFLFNYGLTAVKLVFISKKGLSNTAEKKNMHQHTKTAHQTAVTNQKNRQLAIPNNTAQFKTATKNVPRIHLTSSIKSVFNYP